MATQGTVVQFKYGSSVNFPGPLADPNTLYFCYDTREIYLGSVKYAIGKDTIVNIQGSGDIVNEVTYSSATNTFTITRDTAGSLNSVTSAISSALASYVQSVAASSNSAIDVDNTDAQNPVLSLRIASGSDAGNVTLSEEATGLSASVEIPLSPVRGIASGEKVLAVTNGDLSSTLSIRTANHDDSTYIQLLGINNEIVSEFDASQFIADGMLESVTYDPATQSMIFVFNTASGEQSVIVDLSSLVDTYSAAVNGGLTLDNNNAFSITNSVTAETTGLNTGSHPMSFGQSITLNTITYDSHGLITGTGTYTLSLPALDLSSYYTSSEVDTLLSAKQNTLVSGTNIKTVNGTSILGSGNIDVHEIFECTYGTTTYAEITQALSDSKLPACSYGSPVKVYTLSALSDTQAIFSNVSYASDQVQYNRLRVTNANAWANSSLYVEESSNKVTSLSDSSTDTQYPSAKAVYDELASKANDVDVVHKANAETVSGAKTFSADPILNNDIYLKGKATNGINYNLVGMNSGNSVVVGNSNAGLVLSTSSNVTPSADGTKNLGSPSTKWKDIYLSGQLKDGNNADYGVVLPDTSSWSANKTLATTDIATYSTAGLIKLSSDTAATQPVNAVSSTVGRQYAVQVNGDSRASVNVPWTDTANGYSEETWTFTLSDGVTTVTKQILTKAVV